MPEPRAGLRQLRLQRGESQAQLARGLGINHKTYNHIELGRIGVSGPLLLKLSAYFGLPVEEMARIIYGDSEEAAAADGGDPVDAAAASH